jgi:hypothetical protein
VRAAFALVLLASAAAFADDEGRRVFVYPGIGLGVIGLTEVRGVTFPSTISLELDVEAPWFLVGAQVALVNEGALGFFAGGRAGAFLMQGVAAPYVAIGAGYSSRFDLESYGTHGWGLAPEVGLVIRRDQRWFRPSLVLEAFVPFAQTPDPTKPLDPRWAVSLGFRLRL